MGHLSDEQRHRMGVGRILLVAGPFGPWGPRKPLDPPFQDESFLWMIGLKKQQFWLMFDQIRIEERCDFPQYPLVVVCGSARDLYDRAEEEFTRDGNLAFMRTIGGFSSYGDLRMHQIVRKWWKVQMGRIYQRK